MAVIRANPNYTRALLQRLVTFSNWNSCEAEKYVDEFLNQYTTDIMGQLRFGEKTVWSVDVVEEFPYPTRVDFEFIDFRSLSDEGTHVTK